MDEMTRKCLRVMQEVTKLREILRTILLTDEDLVKIDEPLHDIQEMLLADM